ncbi:TlpA disulfide reductase family protein [Sediminibacterium soli]|uniref:TlpA disulfide reductase family protein n=1 Tax=Sediminibacterium soli TaxID=2698829 RepID=UPI00137A03C1|nr:TlpA disulfide reductase family protein [Sediminibacterium soli]NCI46013.1 TlpA family protein disulfide reductase [Sediminibacterium soli]
MKKIGIVLLLLCFLQALQAQEIKKLKIDQLTRLIDTSSVPTVVTFWATWCGPCVREIPWFEKNVAAYGKKIKMLLVSIDFAEDYPVSIRDFAKKQGYKSQVLWLNETNADVFCPRIDKSWEGAIPATLMVNNKTKYRQFFGQQLPEERFKLELEKLVKE